MITRVLLSKVLFCFGESQKYEGVIIKYLERNFFILNSEI